MTIGIDARFYGPIGGGGLGRYTKELVDNLEQIDEKNQYVIFLRRENWNDYIPRNSNFKKVLAPYKWYSWKEQLMMPWKIWREKVDLMHFPHFNAPLIYSLNFLPHFSAGRKDLSFMFRDAKAPQPELKLGRKTKNFVLTVHDLILMKFPSQKATTLSPIYFKFKFWVYKITISSALRRAGKIIVPSRFVKDDIIKYFGTSSDKIEVIYEGVTKVDKENGFGENRSVEELRIKNQELRNLEIEKLSLGYPSCEVKKSKDKDFKMWYNKNRMFPQGKIPPNPPLRKGERYILYVGNAYPHKNLERLIEAFAAAVENPTPALPSNRLSKKSLSVIPFGYRSGQALNEPKRVKDPVVNPVRCFLSNGVKRKNSGILRPPGARAQNDALFRQPAKGREIMLVLVGVRNYFYERLEKYAKENFPEIKDRIIFFGYATDKELVDLYKNAALYVFPSLQEGFGLPPLEAMSYGVPVVASSESCLPEILNGAAMYFNPLDDNDMADKISRGMEDEKLRNELIKKGYERVKLYDWEKTARETLEIYMN